MTDVTFCPRKQCQIVAISFENNSELTIIMCREQSDMMCLF